MQRNPARAMGEEAGHLLGWLRIAAGAGAWVTPGTTARVLGISGAAGSPVRFVLRLFGSRDGALGLGLLGAETASERDRWLVLGIATDIADAAAAVVAGGRGQLPRGRALVAAASALAAVALATRAREE